jgi:glycosyltransferase involved in cell wall biosynthesis
MSEMHMHANHLPYVLVTPAHNEEGFIENLIQSVICQTALPTKWVIVNDGSTDATASIVNKYLAKHPWMEMVEVPKRKDRSFAKKVHAFNVGYERVKNLKYEVIGCLDADVSFDEDYLEFLMSKFREDSHLGVGGTIFKQDGYSSETDSFEGENHVAGGCQLFRRRCFEEVGGYIPNRDGGIDWIAVTTARMKGWKTQSFREKSFFHHRSLGTAERSELASTFSYGEKAYYLGGHPVWEFFRFAYRATKKPYLVGGIVLYSGYLSAFLRQMKRPVSNELMKFHRKEQMQKLKAILKSLVKYRRLDSFRVTPN